MRHAPSLRTLPLSRNALRHSSHKSAQIKAHVTHLSDMTGCVTLRGKVAHLPQGEDGILMIFTPEHRGCHVLPSSVEADYKCRLHELNAEFCSSRRHRSRAVFVLAVFTALLILSLLRNGHVSSSALGVVAVLGIAFSLREYIRSSALSRQLALRCIFCERGLERLRGEWQALDVTGEEFARSRHLYQFDLDVLGDRSLFTLLCTTRSQAGAERLAAILLDPVGMEETKARQEAVRELRSATALREEIALLGKYQFQGCNPAALDDWMSAPVLRVSHAIPVFLFACGAVILLLVILGLAQFLGWLQVLPIVAPLLLAQATAGARLRRGIRSHLKILRNLTNEFSVLQQGLLLFERQSFLSPKLKGLVDRSRKSNASVQIRRLERLLWGIAQREKELLTLPSLLVAAGTQLVLAVERWRATNHEGLKQWIDCWAEFEALSAIACYAWEHPDDVFPEFVSDSVAFEAEGLGHPLLPAEKCVRNDLTLDKSTRFCILSGSNMAGKSTLLKAVGLNVILAHAGAPVRATRARLASFYVCSSNSISDSLLDGKSKFLAEAERLHGILQQTELERPVLFIIDEILSGTNSHDRRIACEWVVRALVAGGAIGILSTHDLALTSIAELPELRGVNCCMESDDSDDRLNFDYKMKPGVSRRSGALAIMKMIGIDALGPATNTGYGLTVEKTAERLSQSGRGNH